MTTGRTVDKAVAASILTRLGGGDIDLAGALAELRAAEIPAARLPAIDIDREKANQLRYLEGQRAGQSAVSNDLLDDQMNDALEIVDRHQR